jgi:uncharacterized protein (DUF1697 family)
MSPSKAARCTKYVALLRGINVGGKHILPMKQLAEIFADAECGDVRTYIQSGNVIFQAPRTGAEGLSERVARAIQESFGFPVPVILRSSAQLAEVVRSNPFLRAGEAEKTLYIYFLADRPAASAVKGLDSERFLPDAYKVIDQHIYLHLPNGMGRSKLTNAYFDSKLSTVSTARNWATVLKLSAMVQA